MTEGTVVLTGIVEAEASLDPERLIGELTIAEFKQLMNEIGATRVARATGPRAKPEAPEGFTMSVNDIMGKTGWHGMTVRRLCREGLFGEDAVVKVGNQWCVRPEAVDAYIAAKAAKVDARVAAKIAKAEKAAAAKADEPSDAEEIALDELDLEELDLEETELVEIEAEAEAE